MTLPALLLELKAAGLTGLNDVAGDGSFAKLKYAGEMYHIVLPQGHNVLVLESLLRGECEARGWDWALYRSGDEFRAALYRRPGQDSTEVEDVLWSAQAPAEALAGCVLAALKAEKGEG